MQKTKVAALATGLAAVGTLVVKRRSKTKTAEPPVARVVLKGPPYFTGEGRNRSEITR